jgi:DNA-binding MarR family transcriptional regulator
MIKAKFDSLIHAPNRLMICALLALLSEMEFALIQEHLEVSGSVLSKHIKALSDAEYMQVKKATTNGRQRTWLSLTNKGYEAYNAHVKALKEIVG